MNRAWRWFLPGYLWCLPLTLGYLTVAVCFYGAHSFRFHQGVLTCIGSDIWGHPGAQTVGTLQVFADEYQRSSARLRVHETEHVGQQFLCGLAGLFAVPVFFAVLGWSPALGLLFGGFVGALMWGVTYGAIFVFYFATEQADELPGWYDDYRRNPWEIDAYHAGDGSSATSAKEWGE